MDTMGTEQKERQIELIKQSLSTQKAELRNLNVKRELLKKRIANHTKSLAKLEGKTVVKKPASTKKEDKAEQ